MEGKNTAGNERGRFAAALTVREYVEQHGRKPSFNVTGVAMANPTHWIFSVEPYVPTETEITEMLSRIGVGNHRQQKNCGLCGYETCRQRAEAILNHREPVSICRQVVNVGRDVYSVLYENLPVATTDR